jgi:hypothetical protein
MVDATWASAEERLMSGSRKSAYGLLAPVAALGLAGAAFGLATPASAAGAPDGGAVGVLSIPHTFSGTIGENQKLTPRLDCGALGQGLVEGTGSNRTHPLAQVDAPNINTVFVARHTQPYVIFTRIVTSAAIQLTNLGPARPYSITLYCTPTRDHAWRVFG